MKQIFLALAIAAITVQESPRLDELVIEGRVLGKSTSEALPNVLVMLGTSSEGEDASWNLNLSASANLAAQMQTLRNRLTSGTRPNLLQNTADNVLRTAGATGRASRFAFTDSAGRFSFTGLTPGKHTVRAINVPEERYRFLVKNLPPTAYLADIRQSDQSVFDRGVELSDRSDPVQMVISTSGQTVSGTVRAADGKPVEHATAVLVPPEEQRQNPMRYRVADTDSEGLFKWQDVPPGQYTLYVWESILSSAWMNAKVLERYKDRSRVVNVTAGVPLDLQMTAIPDIN